VAEQGRWVEKKCCVYLWEKKTSLNIWAFVNHREKNEATRGIGELADMGVTEIGSGKRRPSEKKEIAKWVKPTASGRIMEEKSFSAWPRVEGGKVEKKTREEPAKLQSA